MSTVNDKTFEKLYYKYKLKYLDLKNSLQKGGDNRYLNKYVKIKNKNLVYDLSIFSLDEIIYINKINIKDLIYITKDEYLKIIKKLKKKKSTKKKK